MSSSLLRVVVGRLKITEIPSLVDLLTVSSNTTELAVLVSTATSDLDSLVLYKVKLD